MAFIRGKKLGPPDKPAAQVDGDCLILSKSLRKLNDTNITLTICVIKSNGTIQIDDEDTEVSLFLTLCAIYMYVLLTHFYLLIDDNYDDRKNHGDH